MPIEWHIGDEVQEVISITTLSDEPIDSARISSELTKAGVEEKEVIHTIINLAKSLREMDKFTVHISNSHCPSDKDVLIKTHIHKIYAYIMVIQLMDGNLFIYVQRRG